MSYIPNTIHRLIHTAIYNKTMQLHLSQLFYIDLVILILTQNMFKMFPNIPRVKNKDSSKADIWIFRPTLRMLYFS